MITITYKIKGVFTQNVGSLENYVLRANYEIEGTDGTDTATITQSVNFQTNADNAEFIPFAELTEALVIKWIKESIEEDGEKIATETVARMIANKKNPPNPIIQPTLPWN